MRTSIALTLVAVSTFSAADSAAQMPRGCCSDMGMAFRFEFSDSDIQNYLNSLGNPLVLFSIDGINFSRVVDTIEYDRFGRPSLFVQGSQNISGTWVDATVRLEFAGLQCLVCSVTGYANPHGPQASLNGNRLGSQNPISYSVEGNNDVEMVIRTDAESPFCAVTFMGQELEIYAIQIE